MLDEFDHEQASAGFARRHDTANPNEHAVLDRIAGLLRRAPTSPRRADAHDGSGNQVDCREPRQCSQRLHEASGTLRRAFEALPHSDDAIELLVAFAERRSNALPHATRKAACDLAMALETIKRMFDRKQSMLDTWADMCAQLWEHVHYAAVGDAAGNNLDAERVASVLLDAVPLLAQHFHTRATCSLCVRCCLAVLDDITSILNSLPLPQSVQHCTRDEIKQQQRETSESEDSSSPSTTEISAPGPLRQSASANPAFGMTLLVKQQAFSDPPKLADAASYQRDVIIATSSGLAGDRRIQIWSMLEARIIASIPQPSAKALSTLLIHPNATDHIVFADLEGAVHLVHWPTGRRITKKRLHTRIVHQVTPVPRDKSDADQGLGRFASCSGDHSIKFWDTETPGHAASLHANQPFLAIAFVARAAPTGTANLLAAAHAHGLRLYCTRTMTQVATVALNDFKRATQPVQYMVSPVGQSWILVSAGSMQRLVVVVAGATGAVSALVAPVGAQHHDIELTGAPRAAAGGDGKWTALACGLSEIALWRVSGPDTPQPGLHRARLRGPSLTARDRPAYAFWASQSPRRVCTVDRAGVAALWDLVQC